jgi:hypothetical protein
VALALLFGSALFLILYHGLLLERDSWLVDYDARFWFLGGVSWWGGQSPYDHARFTDLWLQVFGELPRRPGGFVYPGTILPLSLGLGLFPWDVARWVMRTLNLAAWAGCLAVLWDLMVRPTTWQAASRSRMLWVAVAGFSPAVGQAVYQGQIAVFVALGLLTLWRGLEARSTVWIVAGFLLAMIKPQISLAPTIFLAVAYGDRKVWIGLAATALMTSAVLLWTTPAEFVSGLATSLAEHRKQEWNQPYFYDSAFALLALTRLGGAATSVGVLVGLVAGGVLGFMGRKVDAEARLRLLQIVVAVTLATMPVHRYDQTIHMLLVGSAWALGSPRRGIVLLALCLSHESAYRLVWRLKELTGLPMPLAPTAASFLALLPVAALVWWWWQDQVRRQGPPRPAPAPTPPPPPGPRR